jgi:hypothetical protein
MAINNLSRENLVGVFANKSSNPQEIEPKTANYTLAFPDKDKLITLSSSAGVTVTIPTDAVVDFLVGSKIDIANIGTGTVTVQGSGGVTVNGQPSSLSQYENIAIIKLSTNNWMIQGTPTPPVQNYKSFSLFTSGM